MPEPKTDPFFDEGMRGWIARIARKQFYRVANWYPLDDLIHDGFVCYLKCRNRYIIWTEDGWRVWTRRINDYSPPAHVPPRSDVKHVMALVQRSFRNHIATLAAKHKAVPEQNISSMIPADSEDADGYWDRILPTDHEEATLHTLVMQAPRELQMLVKLLVDGGIQNVEYLRRKIKETTLDCGASRLRLRKIALRETTNEHYCRILGFNPNEVDLLELAEEHFGVELN